jgi:hypothetical protein
VTPAEAAARLRHARRLLLIVGADPAVAAIATAAELLELCAQLIGEVAVELDAPDSHGSRRSHLRVHRGGR